MSSSVVETREDAQVRHRLSRRRFFELSAASALVIGFDPLSRFWITEAQTITKSLDQVPKLDGVLLFDDAARQAVSVDFGRNDQRVPLAVLKPGSVQDIVRMVQYANKHRLKIAMRGQGHSQNGQALVAQGIVIDSSTLNGVKLIDAENVDAQAGASWDDVNRVSLANGLTPPAMGDTMTLSVGGILSAGGWSNRSHEFGAVVDTVRELDVVTGHGRFMTCSPKQHEDLFNLSLAGMGQYALIVRARVRLVAAPSHMLQQDLIYDDLKTHLSDATRLVLNARFHHLLSTVVPTPEGRWRFQINVGQFYDAPKEPNLTALEEGLKFNSKSEPIRVSYGDYLHRTAARLAAAAKAPPMRSASIAMFIPMSTAADFLAKILATPSEVAGMWSLAFLPLNTRKFVRPLFKLPTEDVAFSLWLFRATPLNDATGHATLMDANREILERMRAIGGKVYPPYAPPFSRAEWEDHYGRDMWPSVTAAKRKFDPKSVLTPGPGIFSA